MFFCQSVRDQAFTGRQYVTMPSESRPRMKTRTAAVNVKNAQGHPTLPVYMFDLTDTFMSYMISGIFWFLWLNWFCGRNHETYKKTKNIY